MNHSQQGALRVPGAHLAYEVRGAGPLLFMIAGGSGNGSSFTSIADHLANQYTVLTYDRRGGGRSTLDDPLADTSMERHSADAHALLAALTTEPASVFGSSAGGLVGLDLVMRYPEQVRLLVAHEPTVPGLVPAFDQSQERYLETYRREGALAAIRQITADNGVTYEQREPGVELPPSNMQIAETTAEVLFKDTIPAILRYQLDLGALARASSKIVLAGGRVGRERATPVYQCTVALAEHLGTVVFPFPSHHTGNLTHPSAFAEQLRKGLGKEPGK